MKNQFRKRVAWCLILCLSFVLLTGFDYQQGFGSIYYQETYDVFQQTPYTVDTMVKTAEANGYKVVAAINGDIFDTGTGTPRGTVIHNKNIITSGYHPDRVIAFYEDGTLAMSQVKLEYSYLSLQENFTNQEIIG